MHNKNRYFLVPVPNWVGTEVLLTFWTNDTAIGPSSRHAIMTPSAAGDDAAPACLSSQHVGREG